MSKITSDGLIWSGTGCFIAVPVLYGISGHQRVKFVQSSDVKSSRPSCPRGQNFVLGLEDLSLASDSASSIFPRTVLELFMLASCTPLCLSSLSSFMVVFNYLLVYEV